MDNHNKMSLQQFADFILESELDVATDFYVHRNDGETWLYTMKKADLFGEQCLIFGENYNADNFSVINLTQDGIEEYLAEDIKHIFEKRQLETQAVFVAGGNDMP